MSSIRSDITLIRGDSRNINFTLTGVNLTGATVFFTAKPTLANEETDATAVIEAQTSVFDDPTNGKSSNCFNINPHRYNPRRFIIMIFRLKNRMVI